MTMQIFIQLHVLAHPHREIVIKGPMRSVFLRVTFLACLNSSSMYENCLKSFWSLVNWRVHFFNIENWPSFFRQVRALLVWCKSRHTLFRFHVYMFKLWTRNLLFENISEKSLLAGYLPYTYTTIQWQKKWKFLIARYKKI